MSVPSAYPASSERLTVAQAISDFRAAMAHNDAMAAKEITGNRPGADASRALLSQAYDAWTAALERAMSVVPKTPAELLTQVQFVNEFIETYDDDEHTITEVLGKHDLKRFLASVQAYAINADTEK